MCVCVCVCVCVTSRYEEAFDVSNDPASPGFMERSMVKGRVHFLNASTTISVLT